MLSLQQPLFLLLLIPLAALALLVGWRLGGRLASTPKRLAVLALRVGSLCLLILALAQPVVKASVHPSAPAIFVVDTSASMSGKVRTAEITWLTRALTASPGAQRQLITFGGSPTLMPVPANAGAAWIRSKLAPGPAAGQTDIESAVRLGLGAVPTGGRLVLLSDGLQTTGNVLSVEAEALSRHIPIDIVVLGGDNAADAAVTRMDAPAEVHAGDTLPLQITAWSNRTSKALLKLSQDGRPVGQQTLSLRSGDNPYLVSLRAPEAGWHRYHAEIAMTGDTVAQNNALDAVTRVIGAPRLLVVTGNPRQSPAATLVRRLGLTAQVIAPRAFPTSTTTMGHYDEVILEDLPASALTGRQVTALEQAVHAQGVGLFVLGGAHSLTLGHYSQTPLERLLPVLSDTPGSLNQGTVALQLVLDRSGSMDDLAGDVPKIVMARSAAGIAVDFVSQHKDELGLVSFDIQPHTLIPLQTVDAGNAAHVHSVIDGLTANGGTDIYAALRTGLEQISRSTAPYKHIILMTDGRSEPANYNALLTIMQRDQVTLSTIGLGQDADVQLLQYLAARGKGRFYYTNNANDLPHIFAEEARLSAGSPRVTGTIGVALGASSPVTRSLTPGPLPPIHGYTATILKPGAAADLLTQVPGRGPDPLLAQWQYGLGRVLVWTPGLGTQSAGSWIGGDPTMWDDAVRWALKGATTPALVPRLLAGVMPLRIVVDTQRNGGTFLDLARLAGQAQAPNGTIQPLTIEQVGPGRYEAPLPDGGPGVYSVTIKGPGPAGGQAVALLVVPYSHEYAPPRAPDRALLAQLAGTTGGQLLVSAQQPGALTGSSGDTSTNELWWPLVAIALALFLVDIILRFTAWGRSQAAAGG